MIGKAITYLTNWYVVVNNKIAIATCMPVFLKVELGSFYPLNMLDSRNGLYNFLHLLPDLLRV